MGHILEGPREFLDGNVLLADGVICCADDALSSRAYRLKVGVAPQYGEARVAHLHRVEEVGVTGRCHLGTWPGAQERHRDVWQGAPRLANLAYLHHADLAQPINQKFERLLRRCCYAFVISSLWPASPLSCLPGRTDPQSC